MVPPQSSFHSRVMMRLWQALDSAAPTGVSVEIVSEESEERDRKTKPQRYAEAGIQHFWRIEKETGLPVIHVFELEQATGSYVPTGIVRDRLKLDVPFPLDIDVKALSR
jgi:Uma2 family endonuclease